MLQTIREYLIFPRFILLHDALHVRYLQELV